MGDDRRRVRCYEVIDAGVKEFILFVVVDNWPVEEKCNKFLIAEFRKVEFFGPEPLLFFRVIAQSYGCYGRLEGAGLALVSGAAGLLFGAVLRISAKYCCTYC